VRAEPVDALVPSARAARRRLPALGAEVALLLGANLKVLVAVALGAHAFVARRVDVAPRPVPLRLPVVAEPAEPVLVTLAVARAAVFAALVEVLLQRLLRHLGDRAQGEEKEVASRSHRRLRTRTQLSVLSHGQILARVQVPDGHNVAVVQLGPQREAGCNDQDHDDQDRRPEPLPGDRSPRLVQGGWCERLAG